MLTLPLLAFVALHLPPVQRLLTRQALEAVRTSANVIIEAERVRLSPARLALTAEHVRIAAVGHADTPLLVAGHLEVDLGWSVLTSRGRDIAIEQLVGDALSIRLHRGADGEWNLPASEEPSDAPLPRFTLDDLRITDARVDVSDDLSDWHVSLDDLSLHSTEADAFALAGQLEARVQEEVLQGETSAVATFDGDVLGLRQAVVRSGASRLDVEGRFDTRDGTLDMTGTSRVDARDLAGVLDLPAARGTVDARAHVSGTVEAPVVAWSIAGTDLTDGSAPPIVLDARGTADTSRIAIDALSAAVADGRVAVSDAVVALTQDQVTALHATVSRIDVATLLDSYGLQVPLGGRLDGELDATGPGLDWTTWRSSVRARVRGRVAPGRDDAPLDGLVTATSDNARWQADANLAVADVAVAVATLQGELPSDGARGALAGRIRVDVDDIGRAARLASGAPVDLTGRASLDARVSGTLTEPAAAWTLQASAAAPFVSETQVAAAGMANRSTVSAETITATSGVNRVDGSLRAELTGNQALTGRLRGDLPDLGTLVRADATGGWPVSGGGVIEARLDGTMARPSASADVRVHDLTAAGQHVEHLQAHVSWQGDEVRLRDIDARAGRGRLDGTVQVNLARRTHVAQLTMHDWPIQPVPDATGPESLEVLLPVAATLDVDVDTQGAWLQPSGVVAIDADDVTVQGRPVSPISARFSADGTRASGNIDMPQWRTAGEGTLALDAGYAFEWTMTVDGLTLDPLRPWLPPALSDAEASLSAELVATGSADAPVETTAVRATVQMFSAALADARLDLDRPATIVARHDSIEIDDLAVTTGALVLTAEGGIGRVPADRPLDLRVDGDLQALQPWTSAFGLDASPLTGSVALHTRLAGTVDAPQPTASLALTGAAIEVGGSPLRVPTLQASLADGLVTVADTQLQWRDAQATFSGRVPLRLLRPHVPDAAHPWLGEADTLARFDARATDLQPALLEPFVGAGALEGVSGRVSATLVAEASSSSIEDVAATLTLDEAQVTLQGIPLAQARPTVVRLEDGAVSVKDVLFSGPNTDLAVDGVATLTGDAPSFDVQVRGLTALELLQPFLDGVAPGGRAEIDLHAAGSLTSPDVRGQVLLTDASLRVAEPRLVLEGIDGTATFAGRQMTVSAMRGLANGAPMSIAADLSLTADNTLTGQARLQIDEMPFEYPEGLRVETDVDLVAVFAGERIDVTGDVVVLRGAYRDPIALSALSTSLLAVEAPALDGIGGSGGADVRFGIDVETRDDLLIDNNYGRFAVGGSVRLTGTLAEPALAGRLTVEEGGELYLGGLTYRVERGAVDFANPTRIDPIVDLAAETRVSGERIRIEATGSADELEVTLSAPDASQPLSQAELASLLASGRGLDDLSGTAAGEQLLTLLSADLFGVIGRGVGLDALRLDRDLLLDDRGGAGEVDVAAETDPVARLTLVKRLHSDVEVLFSQNLRDASAITWLVTWKPFRRVEARLLQRDDRSMSYEFRHEVVFGAAPSRTRSRETAPTVSAVTIAVSDPALHDALEDELKLDAGDRFDFYRWQDDRDRLANWLHDHRYYEHRVAARRDVTDGADGPVVSLTYDVLPGPRGTLEIHGVTLASNVVARMREAWQGSVFDGFLAADLTRIVREAMFARGYPLASIDVATTLQDEGRSKLTTVTVEPGPTVTTAVETTGVAAPLDQAFDAWLDAGGRTLAWLDAEALASRARTWLRDRGARAAEVHVSEPVVEGTRAVRTVHVTNGMVYALGRLSVTGVPATRETAVREQLGLSPGAPFASDVLHTATRDLERWYLAEGFREVDVRAVPAVDDEARTVDVTIAVEEGARAVIAATYIDGRERTHEAIFDRALALPLGTTVTPSSLLAARKRLYDTGVVAAADVRVDDTGPAEVEPDGTRVQPVAVTGVVHELPRLRLRYGLAVNDDVLQEDVLRATPTRRVTPGLSALLENRNLFGRAITSGLSARYERARQTGRTFLTTPAILGYDARLQLSAGIARSRLAPDATDSPLDVRTDVSAGVTQTLPWIGGLRLTYGYRYERSRTYDPQNPDLFDITITAPRLTSTAYIDRRDDPASPTRGWFHASTLELSRGWVGSDFEFAKYYVQQSAFHAIGDVVLAGRAQLGLGRGFGGQNLIGSERFTAGGATSVRGYGESAVGEIDPILGIARGDGLLVLNGEVRLPLWRWISGVGFVDAGGVYPRIGDIGWDGLLWGTGAGVRVSTPAGLIRVDVGVPLGRRPGDKAWRAYVGLGQVF